jgi:hypothetical protein
MAYQVLQGVKVTPKGNYNLGRFSKSLVGGSWPTSFAFGGWIYNADCEIGFSAQPTEIKVSIVLEVIDRAQRYAFFDIRDTDLKCDAGLGKDENLYDIEFNGINFTDFILYQYDISIENNAKILNVTFRDYSAILDKIYVGLIKRQGNQFIASIPEKIEFPIVCPDCVLAGDSLTLNGFATRDLSFGSYVGINGKVYDNFANLPKRDHIYSQWEQLFSAAPAAMPFDLNGGYLIIGTEEASSERCGDFANVSYNFNQLLASLRYRGLDFAGAFPRASKDADYFYKQNYIGTLREVLQQWCSDLGYDFYCQGKSFQGVNLNQVIDISKMVDIADPTTDYGSQFALNKNTAIVSYKTSTSLNNTFKQGVITLNNRPLESKVHSKSPKRYVGYLPLHPIDFNRHSNDTVIRYDAFGTYFYDIKWANDFNVGAADRNHILPELDGRTFGEIDTAIALTHYDDTLRDIYVQDRALYGETPNIRAANFAALGMVPLVELTGEDKSMAIENLVPKADGGDEISNICLDKRFYKVFIGYYYPKFKEDIVGWESAAANAMYRYGIVTQGLLNKYPYMAADSLKDISPTSGFYGQQGNSLLRISHNIEPAATQFFQLREAPFKDLILYSGLLTPRNDALPIYLVNSGVFPTGLFYGELNNDWGLTQEDFKRIMSLNLDDPCVTEYSQFEGYTDLVNNIPKKFQDWRLDIFRPQASPDLKDYVFTQGDALENITANNDMDRAIRAYYDLHYRAQLTCSKLHILVLTDTRTHPNVYVNFDPRGQEYVNRVVLQSYLDREREALRRRIQTKTPSICDISLLQEMCKNVLSGQFQIGPTGNPQFACVIDEDKLNFLEEGFPYRYLFALNSRGLKVRVVKNPVRNSDIDQLLQTFKDADIDGNFYYSDVTNNFLTYQSAEANVDIVYPVSTNYLGGYRGVLTSDVELEIRSPEINEIFGEPVNATKNNTTSVKIINNAVDPDLPPQLDPYTSRFLSYLTVITGDTEILTTVEQYHNYVKRLNSYEMIQPMKTVDLSLAGTPNDFGTFKTYLNPIYGLNRLSMSVNDNGVTTSLSFADRPKILPKQEAILNKITPRIKT